MKQKNKNFIYNVIYQIFVFLIPLITTPYISRVLGVDNIGIYSYTYSIVYYFMLTALLGINNYGSREIAKCYNNKEERSKKFLTIYTLQLSLTLIMTTMYILFVNIYDYTYKTIMYIQTIYLISVAFDINWFFFGLEKFKITVTRNIIIKLLSFVLTLICVKTKDDLWIYTLIMSMSTLISQLFLWIFLKKEIVFVRFKVKEVIGHLKKCIVLFIPVIAYSIYRVMDKTMIGSMAGTVELGNYENAEKIINVPISFVTALGTVMLPYMSKNDKNFDNEMKETFKLSFFLIIPMIIGLFSISNDLALILFGKEFEKAGNIMIFLLPTILFSSIATTIRMNYLIPSQKDSIYVKSTIYGAVINFVFNMIFIKKYGAYGACIGTVIAEFTVAMYQILKTKNDIKYKTMLKLLGKYLIKGILSVGCATIVGFFIKNLYIKVVMIILISAILYISMNYKYIYYEFLGKKENKRGE